MHVGSHDSYGLLYSCFISCLMMDGFGCMNEASEQASAEEIEEWMASYFFFSH